MGTNNADEILKPLKHTTRDWNRYFQDEGIQQLPQYIYGYYWPRAQTINHLIKHLPREGTIVELGAGMSLMMMLLSSRGYKTMAIDNNPEVVRLANDLNQRLGAGVQIHEADLFSAPRLFPKCDLAYSEGVIEHYQGSELDEAVQAHKKLGRKVVLVVPSIHALKAADQEGYTYSKLRKVCERNGLRVIDAFGYGVSKYITALLPPFFTARLWKLLRCEAIGAVCQ